MKNHISSLALALTLTAAALPAWAKTPGPALNCSLAQRSYVAEKIDTTPLNSYFYGTSINDRGDVVGVLSGYRWHSAYRPAGGVLREIAPGALTADRVPVRLNNARQILIQERDSATNDQRSYLFAGDQLTELVGLPGETNVYANDINQSGLIVGHADDRPRRWLNGPRPIDRDWNFYGNLTAVNDQNTAAGQISFYNALVSDSAELTRLLPLHDNGHPNITGMNNHGWVIGVEYTTNGREAIAWRNGNVMDLSTNEFEEALDINDNNQIVGWRQDVGAVIFERGQSMALKADLPGFTVQLGVATGINNRGQILAYGSAASHSGSAPQPASFILTPVCR